CRSCPAHDTVPAAAERPGQGARNAAARSAPPLLLGAPVFGLPVCERSAVVAQARTVCLVRCRPATAQQIRCRKGPFGVATPFPTSLLAAARPARTAGVRYPRCRGAGGTHSIC